MTESQEELPTQRPLQAQHLADPAAPEYAERAKPLYPGLPSGTGLGKYRILERIRTYHNAVVYKARDSMLDRLVAVKQMSPDLIDNPIACGNFKREAQLLARIPKDARNIINIHELIEDEIGLFIVEEFVVGHWLESLLFKRQVDHRNAYKLLKTAAWGLKTLHSHTIVHRDIQPGNIMVTKNGAAKIANLASASHEGELSAPPVITPKYAAPELLLERKYDDRVDIYGLGFSLYEVCVGRQAMDRYFANFIGEGIAAVGGWIDWHTNFDARLPDAAELNPFVPAPLAAILRQMTAKNLDERYTSIDQVLDAVGRYFTPGSAAGQRQIAVDLHSPIRLPDVMPPSWSADHLLPGPAGATVGAAAFKQPEAAPSSPWGQRLTRTQPVEMPDRSPIESDRWEWKPPRNADAAGYASGRFSPESRRLAGRRRRRTMGHVPPRPAQLAAIPLPPPAIETFKKHTPRAVTWSFSFVLVLAVVGTGVLAWLYSDRWIGPNAAEKLLFEAVAAYDAGQLEAAKTKFFDVKDLSVGNESLQALQNKADFWLEMIAAQKALALDEFEEVQRLLAKAERRGINPARVEVLQQLAWTKQDAARLAAIGMQELSKGNVPIVEADLEEYEKKAIEAGMDPQQLQDSVDQTKKDQKYEQSMKLAFTALRKEDFNGALASCAEAEAIRITTATRELRKRINDLRQRKDLVTRGDQAMVDRDFATAEAAYVQANQILASPDIEQKSRAARSYILIQEARQAVKEGELLLAEQKLKSSLWNAYTAEAKSMLDGMTRDFDAARIVRRGDQALDREEFDDAVRLYNEAIPKLPAPAAAKAKQKIVEVQRARLIKEGDQALKRMDRQKALKAYAAAQDLRDDPEIQARIENAKSPYPTSSRPNGE